MASESAQKLYQLHAKLQQEFIVPQPAQMHSRARAKLSCQWARKQSVAPKNIQLWAISTCYLFKVILTTREAAFLCSTHSQEVETTLGAAQCFLAHREGVPVGIRI